MTPGSNTTGLEFSDLISRDPAIRGLRSGQILSVPYLEQHTKNSPQQIRQQYKYELLSQMNQLIAEARENYDRHQIAQLMGYTPDAVSRNKSKYHLPNPYFRSGHEGWIHVQHLARELDQSTQWIRNVFKPQLLGQLHCDLVEGRDGKTAAQRSGLSYRQALDWINRYQLGALEDEEQQKGGTYENQHRTRWEGALSYQPGTERELGVGPLTRLINHRGQIFTAQYLCHLDQGVLDQLNPFLMFGEDYQLVLGDIINASWTSGVGTKVITRLGGEIIIGPQTGLIADMPNGLEVQVPDHRYFVLAVRSLHDLPSSIPSVFDLLETSQERIGLVLQDEVLDTIKIRLGNKYGNFKHACAELAIAYKQFFRKVVCIPRSDLISIYNDIGYPDITSPYFMHQVTRLKLIKQGSRLLELGSLVIDPDFMYLMGLTASDGWLEDAMPSGARTTVGFSNVVEELHQEAEQIIQRCFPSSTISFREPSSGKYTASMSTTNNFVLQRIINNLRIKGREVEDEEAYVPVFRMPLGHIAGFLQGLFDGDGTVDLSKQMIGIAVFNGHRVQMVQLLLKRIGIVSKIKRSKQLTRPPHTKKQIKSDQLSVEIAGKENLLKFIERAGSRHPDKKEKLDKLKKRLSTTRSIASKYSYAPLMSGKLIRKLRVKAGISQKGLGGKSEYTVWAVENLQGGTSKSRLYTILKKLRGQAAENDYNYLKLILEGNYLTDIVEEYTEISGDLVNFRVTNKLITNNGIIIDQIKL